MRILGVLTAALFCSVSFPTTSNVRIDGRGFRLNNLKVLSDKTDDVTTVENILKSFTKAGMTDEERAKGIWTAAVKYRHQTSPPNEHLAADWEAHDPVKLFNVYGYCMCCCASAIIESLNRADGREARGRILNGHSVPEVFYGGGWHMFDASLLTYFPKPVGGIASVDEISKAVKEWYAANPGYRGNQSKLQQFMRADGWNGFKKGPALLAASPFYNLGWFPARTHGWDATMVEYDRDSEVYEYGYQMGHRALFSLRPGEIFVREAGNRGLHVNGGKNWDVLKQKAPNDDLVYLKKSYPGYTGGVVANGTHRYTPNLATGDLALSADVYENVALGPLPLRTVERLKPGVIVIEMRSPWVYLGGSVRFWAECNDVGDRVTASISTDNGRTFRRIGSVTKSVGPSADIDIGSFVERRYAYWLKIEMLSAGTGTVGLKYVVLENDFQHAPRTLPWLAKGANSMTVSADSDTSIATRTVSCRITPDSAYSKNESVHSMGVKFDNLDVREEGCWWKGGTGAMTVPISTPGEITALRFGAQVRARGQKDLVRMLASFDGGSTWTEAAKIAGPTPGTTQYFKFTQIPAGARKALLKYELTGNNTVGIFSFRVDADYRDPLAAPGFRPFRVVHRWKENGQEKSHAQTIPRLPFSYPIAAESDPEMVSVSYEMPTGPSVAKK